MIEENKVFSDGIIKNLKIEIKNDVSLGMEKSQAEYLDRALDDLKQRYKFMYKWNIYKPWSKEFGEDLTRIWMDIKPEVLEAIEKFLMDFKHRKLTKEIKAATAKAAIGAAMKEAGLKHQITPQTHRAKVSVLITSNRALTSYISYKKLYEQLPSLIESLKVIMHELESLGSLVTINKAYNTFDWE